MIAGLAALVLLSSVPLFKMANKNFLPEDDQSEFETGLRAPEGSSLEATEIIASRIATRVRQLPEVEFTLVSIADDPARTQNQGSVFVRLKQVGDRERDQFEVMNEVRAGILPSLGIEHLRTGVRPVATFGGGGNQNAEIQFTINGPDLNALEQYGSAVADAARTQQGLVDVDTSLNVGKPELSVHIDRMKAADLGVQVADAAEALRLLVGGDQVTTYNEGGEQYEVHLRAAEVNRGDAAAIGRLSVPSSTVGSVPLENIARLASGTSPAEIHRLNRQRQVTIYAGLLPGVSQTPAMEAIAAAAASLNMGPGYSSRFAGRSKELGRAAQNFLIAFLLSLVFMYLILAAQFESWLHPVTILLSLPLTLPFALLSIIVTGQSLNIFFGARASGAVRSGEEELDPADRSRQPAARAGDAARRGDPAGEPRPAPSHPDDDVRVRGWHDSPGAFERCRFGDQPGHRFRHYRRSVSRAALDSRCYPCCVFTV